MLGLIIGIAAGTLFLLFLIIFLAAAYTKAGPDEAIMISGAGRRKILRGKAGWRFPFPRNMPRSLPRIQSWRRGASIGRR